MSSFRLAARASDRPAAAGLSARPGESSGRVVSSEKPVYRQGVMWWSIEVFDGAFPAALWQEAHGRFLVEAALTRRGRNWWWHRHDWGVVFEVEFDDEDSWDAFRRLPAVQAALDAVPDPVNGLLVYPGRGGSAGSTARRPTRPTSGSGAAAMPIPPDDLLPVPPPDPRSSSADLLAR